MSINTRENYIEIGIDYDSDYNMLSAIELPAPIEIPSSNEFMVEAERNADGTMIIEQVGRTQYTTQIKWSSLPNKKWWELNRWFEDFGYVFYMKYFNHNDGCIKIQRFYRGNIEKATPSTQQEIINGISVPKKYLNVGFSIIDMGEDEVIEVEVLDV